MYGYILPTVRRCCAEYCLLLHLKFTRQLSNIKVMFQFFCVQTMCFS